LKIADCEDGSFRHCGLIEATIAGGQRPAVEAERPFRQDMLSLMPPRRVVSRLSALVFAGTPGRLSVEVANPCHVMSVNPYQSPEENAKTPASPNRGPESRTRWHARPQHTVAIFTGLVQQGICLLIAALVLDQGETLQLTLLGVIACWIATLIIMIRRPQNPTNLDMFVIKYGIWPAFVGVFALLSVLNAMHIPWPPL